MPALLDTCLSFVRLLNLDICYTTCSSSILSTLWRQVERTFSRKLLTPKSPYLINKTYKLLSDSRVYSRSSITIPKTHFNTQDTILMLEQPPKTLEWWPVRRAENHSLEQFNLNVINTVVGRLKKASILALSYILLFSIGGHHRCFRSKGQVVITRWQHALQTTFYEKVQLHI